MGLAWADLWSFHGLYCKRLSLSIKVYQRWGLKRSGPTDPSKPGNYPSNLNDWPTEFVIAVSCLD